MYLVIFVGFENHVNIVTMPNKISTLPPITITTTIIMFKRLAKKAWVTGRFATHTVRITGAEQSITWGFSSTSLEGERKPFTRHLHRLCFLYMSSHLIFKSTLVGITSSISANEQMVVNKYMARH